MRHTIAGAVAAVLILGASGPLYQLELLSLSQAYVGVGLAVALGAVAFVSSLRLLIIRGRQRQMRSTAAAIGAGAIALFTIVVPMQVLQHDRRAAPVHDITTDFENPPAFDVLLDVEPDTPRPARADAVQRQSYPDIKPIVLPVTADMAFEEVLETFTELDWPVADGNHDAGVIEGTLRTPWFGFRDDVVVRLTPVGDQTRVDVRSVSRDKTDDGGRNAEHVREFLVELQR